MLYKYYMRLITLLSLLSSLLLAGCMTTQFPKGSSGMVYWHKLETQDDIIKACLPDRYKGPLLFNIRGCYKIEDKVCHIYTQDGKENMGYLGHELKHCFDGHFHDSRGVWINHPDENGSYVD